MKNKLPYLAGISSSIIFGFSFLFTKNAIESLSTFELLFLRFTAAFVSMSILVLFKIIKVDFKGKDKKILIMIALWQPIIYFIMETLGLQRIASSQAGVMMALIPVIVALLGIFMLGEVPKIVQVVYILISVCGVVLTVIGSGEASQKNYFGVLFILLAVICAALFNIFSRRASVYFTPYEITYAMMFIGMIVFGCIFIFIGIKNGNLNILPKLSLKVVVSVVYLGLFSSVLAYLLVNYNLSRLPASQSAVFANLTTVVSIIAGVAFKNEEFGIYKIIGSVLIILGVWGTNYYNKEKIENVDFNENK